jgi:hypothetical protein
VVIGYQEVRDQESGSQGSGIRKSRISMPGF